MVKVNLFGEEFSEINKKYSAPVFHPWGKKFIVKLYRKIN